MTLLVDTHALLWWLHDDVRLPDSARRIFLNPDTNLLLSAASAWEIAIKYSTGQLELSQPPSDYLPEQLRLNRIGVLDITMVHALRVAALPKHHKDPFDRLIVAQAMTERIPILTGDKHFGKYEVRVKW